MISGIYFQYVVKKRLFLRNTQHSFKCKLVFYSAFNCSYTALFKSETYLRMDANYSIAHRPFFGIDDNKKLTNSDQKKKEKQQQHLQACQQKKERLGKIWAPLGRKCETFLSRTWRKLMYSMTFLPAKVTKAKLLPASHKNQGQDLGKTKNCTLYEKVRFVSILGT